MAETFDSNHTMTLKVKKFRAINNARIDLDGITVITGENGSGKSTLSKILYNTIKYSKKYELLIGKELNSELREIAYALYNSVQEINRYGKQREIINPFPLSRNYRRLEFRPKSIEDIEEYQTQLFTYFNIIKDSVFSNANDEQLALEFSDTPRNKKPSTVDSRIKDRIGRVFQEMLLGDEKHNDFNLEEALDLVNKKISTSFEKAYRFYDLRPIHLFSKTLATLYDQAVEKKFDLVEYGLPITDWKEDRFNNTNWIKNSIYIDTPMAVDDGLLSDIYRRELRRELTNDNEHYANFSGFNEINNIIEGSVYYENENLAEHGFKYKRNDGNVFNIDDCATGIKAFGILQLLANNGKLTKDTLLIVDEPEAHLHPQWIVDYARIVVLMNKHFGVKFFIASHNPDMVSAIKYISEKEGVSDRVNFYLAKKRPDGYTYDYKALKTDIEDIFSSFNIAIERINQYGVQDA